MYKYQTYTLAIPHVSPLYFIFLYPSMNADIINALSTYWYPYFFSTEKINFDDNSILIKKDHVILGMNNRMIIPYLTPIALFKIVNDIIRRNSICEKNWHILHASSYDINKKTFIFTGESGSGKSTLIAYLLSQNPNGYNGDDIAIVNHEKNILEPNNRNIFLRQSSIPILQQYNSNTYLNNKYSTFLNRIYIESNCENENKEKEIFYILNLNYNLNVKHTHVKRIEKPYDMIKSSFFSRNNIENNFFSSISLYSKNNYYNIYYNNLKDLYLFLETL